MTPTIIAETSDYLIINKPAGLIVHSDGRTKEPSLSDWLLENYPKIKEVGEPWTSPEGEIIYRPGIVHRLDRETSGVMVIAKNEKMYENLKKQFQNREVKKIYQAFVYGEMKEEKGTIDRPIGKSSKDFRRWSAQRGARGELREAVTKYKVIKTGNDNGAKVSLLELEPLTGRTHQIRVHMKAINHGVVGDSLYAPKQGSIFGFKRTALHARSLEFSDLKGKRQSFEAPYPSDFDKAVEAVLR